MSRSLGNVDGEVKAGNSKQEDHVEHDCNQEPLFYSIRNHREKVERIPRIDIDAPASVKQQELHQETIVASIDRIESGFVSGWVSSCENGSDIFHAILTIDSLPVVSTNIEDVYNSPPLEIKQLCSHVESLETNQNQIPVPNKVLKFNISFPLIPIGIHTMRMFINANNSSDPSENGTWIEAYHSPIRFEESTIEPSTMAMLSRKDEIITQRNNQLSKLYNELKTRIPWKISERDAEEIPLSSDIPSDPEHAAVILVHSEPQNQNRRIAIRSSWGLATRDVNIVLRFVLDKHVSGPHKSMIQQEMKSSADIFLTEMQMEKSVHVRKVLHGISRAVKDFDASFYFISQDSMLVIPQNLAAIVDSLKDKGNVYIGCMKSGPVITDTGNQWFEREHWRFGDAGDNGERLQYPRHAKSHFYGFAAPVARYLARNKEILFAFSNEDVTIGTWLLGLDIEYIDEGLLCCDVQFCKSTDSKSRDSRCAVFSESSCHGLCSPDSMPDFYRACNKKQTTV